MGAACPVACNTAIATQWFKINTDATKTCLSRPGNSGENSMRSGSCHSTSMYSYSRWITCDCSGGETVKDAKSDGCYIDNPTSLCSRAVDMVKFHWLHDHQLRYSDRSDGVWFCRRRAHLRHCLEYLLQYWLHRHPCLADLPSLRIVDRLLRLYPCILRGASQQRRLYHWGRW